MGPPNSHRMSQLSLADVSALSGESILGPPSFVTAHSTDEAVFQHSLVSLFWGHHTVNLSGLMRFDVSALSGESILGPPDGPGRHETPFQVVSALSGESILGPPGFNVRLLKWPKGFSTLW